MITKAIRYPLVMSLLATLGACSDTTDTTDRTEPGTTPDGGAASAAPSAAPDDSRSKAGDAGPGAADSDADASDEVRPPPAPAGAESGAYVAPPCTLSTWGIAAPTLTSPVVRVEDFGAAGDGVTDDTAAINAAVQSLTHGGTVMFAAGKKYLRKGKVDVNKADVQLWGYGATILAHYAGATGDAHSTFYLSAPGAAIYGLTIVSDARLRNQGGNDNAAVWTSSERNRVMDNRIEYGAGLMFRLASDYVAARNVVYRTTADAIHTTTGSKRGRVVCNTVRENGDDMIAVVNYGPKNSTPAAPDVEDILIEGNDVSGNYWGRGISVMGGKNVTVRNNHISRTIAAAIITEQEGGYHTTNVDGVTIENNVIRDVQTLMPVYTAPNVTPTYTGHGAIEIAAAYGSVRGLVVKNNDIDHVGGNGIRVRGGVVCGTISDNTIANAGAAEILDNGANVANCTRTVQNNH